MLVMTPPPKLLAHYVAKMALHIRDNEGRIEREDYLIKKVEQRMHQTEAIIERYKKEAFSAGQKERTYGLHKQHIPTMIAKRRAEQLRKARMHLEGQLNKLRQEFQKHVLHKVGLEKHELFYLYKSKQFIRLILSARSTSATKDKGFIGSVAARHELTGSQANHLRNTLNQIPTQARYFWMKR